MKGKHVEDVATSKWATVIGVELASAVTEPLGTEGFLDVNSRRNRVLRSVETLKLPIQNQLNFGWECQRARL